MKIDKYELARKLGVSHQAVYKWFDGKCLPRADKLIKIASILNVTPKELLNIMQGI